MNPIRTVVIIGGDEFASAIAIYLFRSRIPVILRVHSLAVALRRPLCFNEAVFAGKKMIADVNASLVSPEASRDSASFSYNEFLEKTIRTHLLDRIIPCIVEEDLHRVMAIFHPSIIILTEKERVPGIDLSSAKLIIGLYPYHHPGKDCHLSVETRLNYYLGQVYQQAPEEYPDLDIRFFKSPFQEVFSPLEGVFLAYKEIGQSIKQNEPFGVVNHIEIRSPYGGQIWGLFHSGRMIHPKQALALVYTGPSGNEYLDFDYRHRVIAGAVLREVLSAFSLSF
ncbi:MAG: hypothetical protein Kow0042_21760 [Calditrichia bacterium]